MIAEILGVGRDAAKCRAEIARTVGLSDRQVRSRIAEERAQGIPIISSSYHKGYWLPDRSPEGISDMQTFLREMRARRSEISRVIAGLSKLQKDALHEALVRKGLVEAEEGEDERHGKG